MHLLNYEPGVCGNIPGKNHDSLRITHFQLPSSVGVLERVGEANTAELLFSSLVSKVEYNFFFQSPVFLMAEQSKLRSLTIGDKNFIAREKKTEIFQIDFNTFCF